MEGQYLHFLIDDEDYRYCRQLKMKVNILVQQTTCFISSINSVNILNESGDSILNSDIFSFVYIKKINGVLNAQFQKAL